MDTTTMDETRAAYYKKLQQDILNGLMRHGIIHISFEQCERCIWGCRAIHTTSRNLLDKEDDHDAKKP
ncbi:hypothetical protein DM860_003443 [Cuscuta australis]|nr:hypothetical protein DM860_003443 [Cuscuta australis]